MLMVSGTCPRVFEFLCCLLSFCGLEVHCLQTFKWHQHWLVDASILRSKIIEGDKLMVMVSGIRPRVFEFLCCLLSFCGLEVHHS